MKILFFSDIHGVYDNLEKLKQLDNIEHFDKVVSLGDMFYHYGREVKDLNKIVEFLNGFRKRLIALRGNCDYDNLSLCNFDIINDYTNIIADGINIYMTHGHKCNRDTDFFDGDILVYGHEHVPYIDDRFDRTYINVGSISLPRGNFPATYGIYSNKEFLIYSVDGVLIDKIECKVKKR